MENKNDSNRKMAEFMGYTFSKFGKTARLKASDPRSSPYRLSDFHYHNSWNLLMPVVEKICSLSDDYEFHIEMSKNYNCVRIWDLDSGRNTIDRISAKTALEATYTACLRFIKFFEKIKEEK